MAKRTTSTNFEPIPEHLKINLWDIEDSILQDLKVMSRESFWKNELHNEHHRQLADRKYQQEWRDSNREAVRTYQRNYARKRRGTSPEMYRLSK